MGFAGASAPDQVHLAFADREDEMRVMFVTGGAEEEFVKYGLEGKMDSIVGTKVTRYEKKDMCDSPANSSSGWRDPGYIHDGVMTNLHQGRKYYYRVSFLTYLSIFVH